MSSALISQVFNIAVTRDIIFGFLRLDDAITAREAVNARCANGQDPLRVQDYNNVRGLICEDPNVTINPPRPALNANYGAHPPDFEPYNTASVPCTNLAKWTNPVSTVPGFTGGVNEPSLCRETAAPSHIPVRHRLVCASCKTKRSQDLIWRRRELWFPICGACHTHATANPPQNQHECDCPPIGPWNGGYNGNEARSAHLCRDHDRGSWMACANRAQAEITRRRVMRKKKKPALSHYRKPRPSSTPWNQLTPAQRRAKMRTSDPGWLWAIPRCYCGNPLTRQDRQRPNGHTQVNAAGVTVPVFQWRNCTTCHQFVNTSH